MIGVPLLCSDEKEREVSVMSREEELVVGGVLMCCCRRTADKSGWWMVRSQIAGEVDNNV
jgi:hypothetical protein